MEVTHLTAEDIEAHLDYVMDAPADRGRLEAIVVRPASDQRALREAVYLSPEGGLEGDRWAATAAQSVPGDGKDPRAQQVSLMNARLLRLIAADDERMALAGDNLIVDLDLSQANLPAGQKLAIGEVVIQISDQPHTGCGKFAQRFGPDAVRFINAAERKPLRLRGVYARVLEAGTIHTGDAIHKIQ